MGCFQFSLLILRDTASGDGGATVGREILFWVSVSECRAVFMPQTTVDFLTMGCVVEDIAGYK